MRRTEGDRPSARVDHLRVAGRPTTVAAARPRGLTADERHRSRHQPPPATHQPRPRASERPLSAVALVDGAIVALLFHGALRRSEVASLALGRRRPQRRPRRRRHRPSLEVRPDRRSSGRATSGRRLRGRGSAACTPQSHRNREIRSSASASTRSTAGSPPPAPPASRGRGPRTAAASVSPSSSPPAGPPRMPSDSPAAGRTPPLVVRYAATVSTREGAISRPVQNPPGSHWRRSPPLRRRTTTKGPGT